jgi:hypothetical protein
VPSDSRVFQGKPGDQTVAGMRKTIITPGFGSVNRWSMTYLLDIPSLTTLVSTGDRQRARKALQRIIQDGGGRLVRWQEDFDRTGGEDMSGTIVERAKANNQPEDQTPRVQQDWERRLEVDRIQEGQSRVTGVVASAEFTFRLMFSLVAVVQS